MLSAVAVVASPDVVMLMSLEAGSETEGGLGVAQTVVSPLDSAGEPQAEALSFYGSRGQQSDDSPGASPGPKGQGAPPECLTVHQDSRCSEPGTTKLPSGRRTLFI